MGVYIKGMEMPRSCAECPVNMNICKRGYKYLLAHMELYDQRANDCPISTVPPHGRLIDADKMRESIRRQAGLLKLMGGELSDFAETLEKGFLQEIANAPTIIPAEEGE